MRWLAVHLPMFALEVIQAGQNTRAPTVLVEGSRVLLGNRAALQTGIGLQRTLATACGICPHLIHYQRDPGKELKHLQLLAEMCYRFTSRVSLEPSQGMRAASGLLLEAGGSLKLFGSMHAWQSRVAGLCRELGHVAVLRTAATPSAALALARASASRLSDVALIHTELAGSEVESLSNMGIKTLGPLLQLPEAELGQRFGARLINYLGRLTAVVPDPRHCIEPQPMFASSLNLLDPITDKGALLFPMQRLLSELQCWLIGRQLGAGRLLWRFAPHESATGVSIPVRFAAARQRKVDFIEIVRLALNQAELPENVLQIGLKAGSLVPWTTHSQTLFRSPPGQSGGRSLQLGSARGHPSHEKSLQPGSARGLPLAGKSLQLGSANGYPPQKNEAPTELIDRFIAQLGEAGCSGIATTGQYAPEQAWRLCRAGEACGSLDGHGRVDRPLWFFDSPQRVNRKEFEVLRGPERLQTSWWRHAEGFSLARGTPSRSPAEGSFHARGAPSRSPAEGSHRDYYVVRRGNGARGWAFVDSGGQWFLHGYFG